MRNRARTLPNPTLRTGRRSLVAVALALAGATVAAGEKHQVFARPDNTFSPAALAVAVGDAVTWTNQGGFHNVNAPGFFRCANGCDGEGGDGNPSGAPWSFTRTFSEAATVDYQCDAHVALGMVGRVVVGDGGDPVPTLTVAGLCPGSVSIDLAGFTPEQPAALLTGAAEGLSLVPAGPCAGTELGVAEPRLLTVQAVDEGGELSLSREVPEAACARLLQALDLATCEVSGLARLPAGPGVVALELVADGLDPVTNITHAGDGSGRVFVALQSGVVVLLEDGLLLPEPFLDIRDRVRFDPGFERGLVGLAFHPRYAQNGRLFVVYNDFAGDSILAGFLVSPTDPDKADPASERRVQRLPQPDLIHNMGQLAFGPDGYLYVGTGDGGPVGDPEDRAQDLSLPYGKILRLDVDSDAFPDDDQRNYSVPPDNPFVGVGAALPEIWAYGLRNPWRFSFDRATGDLFIGDVGQDRREEVSFQPAGSPGGENYGWSLVEGSLCFDPPAGCEDLPGLTAPILEYPHEREGRIVGCAVTGGYRYRGTAIPALAGVYLFADLCTGRISGAAEAAGGWRVRTLIESGLLPTTFGEDEAGELYLGVGGVLDGSVYRLVSP